MILFSILDPFGEEAGITLLFRGLWGHCVSDISNMWFWLLNRRLLVKAFEHLNLMFKGSFNVSSHRSKYGGESRKAE